MAGQYNLVPPSSSVITDFDGHSTICASSHDPDSPSARSQGPTTPTAPTAPTSAASSSPQEAARATLPGQSRAKSSAKPTGWPALAQVMARAHNFESFPRFRELNVKNLLYYQVEIATQEEELKRIEMLDSKSEKRPRRNYAKLADSMLFPADDASPEDRQQREVVLNIRRLLKEYSESRRHFFLLCWQGTDGATLQTMLCCSTRS